ncbi:hypothetical protein BaRGS_00024263 [Batillaria attramentaria]|uniref:Neugrin n=1 Tax=Batillaria attramentaria TaxID=370345 RepID=A0ABD0KBR2_9CAEN
MARVKLHRIAELSLLFLRPFSVSYPALGRGRRRFVPDSRQEPEELDHEAIEDFIMESGSRARDIREASDAMLQKDFHRQKVHLKQKIMARKHFKKPQEINLLTWEAKEQIRYLHNKFPDEWTPEALAESFPVSREGVLRILQSSYTPRTQDEIVKHNIRVAAHWRQLRDLLKMKGGQTDSANFRHVLDTGKLPLMLNAGGLPSLPVSRKPGDALEDAHQQRDRQIGIFESIVAGSCRDKVKEVTLKLEQGQREKGEENLKLLKDIAVVGKCR